MDVIIVEINRCLLYSLDSKYYNFYILWIYQDQINEEFVNNWDSLSSSNDRLAVNIDEALTFHLATSPMEI